MVPDTNVPVIIVPNPDNVNARSIGSLGIVCTSFDTTSSLVICTIVSISESNPSPVAADTFTTGACSRNVPCSSSFTSSSTNSSHSSSTRSHLFSTIMLFSIPRRFRISICSLVCGIIPSSAAITNRTRSIPTTPATMLLINLSCPGTSIIPARSPLGRSKYVKPRSIVIPLLCSSSQRSVFLPVNALINVVFPWSM